MKTPVSTTVLGARLQQARKRADLTQQRVAEQIGMARTTVVAIERGDRNVRPDELVTLAKLYGADVHELLRDRPTVGTISLQFRAGAKLVGVEEVESFAQRLTEDYLWLERARHAPMPRTLPTERTIVDSAEKSGRLAAEDERLRLGLGSGPIPSVRTLLEERIGIRVFLTPPSLRHNISGAYFWDEAAGPVAIVSGVQSWTRRRWSGCHELGHAIGSRYASSTMTSDYDPLDGSNSKPQSEEFADAFARHFLMPVSYLERFVSVRKAERSGKFLVSDIAELSAHFGVSIEAMARALEDAELVKKGAAAYIISNSYRPKNENAGQEHHADKLSSVVSPRFQRLAFATYANAEITEGTLAQLLRVSRDELRALIETMADDQLTADFVRGESRGGSR